MAPTASPGTTHFAVSQTADAELPHTSAEAKENGRLKQDEPSRLSRHLFSASVVAKIWGIAVNALDKPVPPIYFPEYTEPGSHQYVYRHYSFWTSGFFPGSLYLLAERKRRFGHLLGQTANDYPHDLHLDFASKWWTESLHQNATLQGTHDLGFMIAPWAKLAWELNHDARAFVSMNAAATTLASRYNPVVKCMRSWDTCTTNAYRFDQPDVHHLTIIDNMMNLDLLFYVASATGNDALYNIAYDHAATTMKELVRSDYSTGHLVVFDPTTGKVIERLTNQGYSPGSCWSRGQAWGIAGFAQSYSWTKNTAFLNTAIELSKFFLKRLPESGIAPWDFDAPNDGSTGEQPPDTSATIIAAYGMLLIHEALVASGETSHFLESALKIIDSVCQRHLNDPASFSSNSAPVNTAEDGEATIATRTVDIGQGDTILNGATINNYQFAPRRWADHGLVYADYYFLLVGNKLLAMGLGPLTLQPRQEVPDHHALVNGSYTAA